jgi:hypothetical protein
MTLGHLTPTFGTHRSSSSKRTLTMPHPSEGSHHAFDRNQPPTQANISITTAKNYQNDKDIIYIQSSPRVAPPQITCGEQKQVVA